VDPFALGSLSSQELVSATAMVTITNRVTAASHRWSCSQYGETEKRIFAKCCLLFTSTVGGWWQAGAALKKPKNP